MSDKRMPQDMSLYHQKLQLYLYKKKLNEMNIMELLDKLSAKTVKYIMYDLGYMMSESQDDELYIFSDGNCKGNGKKDARAGYSVFFSDDIDSKFYKFNKTRLIVTEPTNNKAELSGIKYIFKTILENEELFKTKKIVICTDSMYSINCIEKWSKNWVKNGWKNSKGEEVKNKEIIKDIISARDAINKDIVICFKHIMSHLQEPQDKNSIEWTLWYGNNKVDSNINELLNKSY